MDKFLEAYTLPIMNHEERENLNKQIKSKEIKSIIQNVPWNKSLGPDGFRGEFY